MQARLARGPAQVYPRPTMADPFKLDPMFVTTEAVIEAGGVSGLTINTWVKAGLLPAPKRISTGARGGLINIYPAWAIERARFIREKRLAGHTLDEVLALAQAIDGEATARASKPRPRTTQRR